MNEEKKVNITLALPWGTILTIIFVVLKLTKVISWSWLWVLAPLWISVAATVLVLVIMFIIIVLNTKD